LPDRKNTEKIDEMLKLYLNNQETSLPKEGSTATQEIELQEVNLNGLFTY
jgi:hypothetical protein